MKNKRCYKCKKTKPVSMFDKNRTKPDGLQRECKECRKQYYASHRDEKLKQMKEYYATPKGKMQQAKRDAKKRNLGFKLLYPLPKDYYNNPQNFCFHHVDDTHVVCIPHRLHKIDRSNKHREALTPFIKIFYFDHIMESRGGR